jgi:hypothetical protein
MSIFILFNKNLKGKWRKILIILYALHITLFFGMLYMGKTKIINGDEIVYIFLMWCAIVICISITEFWFLRSKKIK